MVFQFDWAYNSTGFFGDLVAIFNGFGWNSSTPKKKKKRFSLSNKKIFQFVYLGKFICLKFEAFFTSYHLPNTIRTLV